MVPAIAKLSYVDVASHPHRRLGKGARKSLCVVNHNATGNGIPSTRYVVGASATSQAIINVRVEIRQIS